jgi:CheY-like chemotaxis protein
MPRFRDTPAVFLTAKAEPEDIDKLMKAGAAAVITKPFDAMKLPEPRILTRGFRLGRRTNSSRSDAGRTSVRQDGCIDRLLGKSRA